MLLTGDIVDTDLTLPMAPAARLQQVITAIEAIAPDNTAIIDELISIAELLA
jgi:hypothetical protein